MNPSIRTLAPRPLVLRVALLAVAAWSVGLVLHPAAAHAGEHRLGVGAHFWKTVDDLADDGFSDIEDEGYAWVFSYQYLPGGLLRFEVDVEYYDEGFGGSADAAFSPIGFVLIGGDTLYAGVGLGVTFSDGLEDDVSDPFYAARIGLDFALLPGLSVDVNANYRANAFSDLDEADTDAVTLGAVLRFRV